MRPSPATGRRSPATPAPRSNRSRASPRRSPCSTRAGSTPSSTTASPFYAYLAETGDTVGQDRRATTGEKSEQGFAARKNSGLLPELNKALDELRADGTLAKISEKYLKAERHRCRPPRRQDRRRTLDVAADPENLWPLAKAAITDDHPADHHQLRHRPGDRTGGGVGAAVPECRRLTNIARFYISIIRGTPLLVQLFIIFYALPQLGIKLDPFPAAVIAFSLNVGGYAAEIIRSAIQSIPKGQWEAAETIGLQLRRCAAPDHPAAGRPGGGAAAVEHVDLAGEGHVAGVDDPGDRTAAAAQIVAAPTFEFFALYGTAAAYYWVICLVLSFGQNRLERRLERYVAR